MVNAEGIGALPAALVLIQSGNGHVVANAVLGGVLPDRSLQPPQAQLVDWLRSWYGSLGLLWGWGGGLGFSHFEFLLSSEEDLGPAPENEDQVSGTKRNGPRGSRRERQDCQRMPFSSCEPCCRTRRTG